MCCFVVCSAAQPMLFCRLPLPGVALNGLLPFFLGGGGREGEGAEDLVKRLNVLEVPGVLWDVAISSTALISCLHL